MTSRPFTYNPGSLIPGTEKFGNLTIGIPESGFESTGLQWWNGPDEDLGYVIASTNVDINGNGLQPTPVLGQLGNVGFNRTNTRMYSELVGLSNVITGQNFTTHYDAKIWLENNGYWSSWVDSIENDIDNFTDRITTDSGQFESIDTILPSLSGIDTGLTASSPSLILTPNGYKETKLYSIKPYDGTGDFTVVRATTGTRVNSDGLVEVVPYNLLSYSQNYSSWTKSNLTITDNSTLSPDGSMTGALVVEGTNSGLKFLMSPLYGKVGTIHTASFFIKKNTRNWAYLTFGWDGAGDRAAYFDLENGVIGNIEGGVSPAILDIGNGWYRCSITGIMQNSAPRVFISMATGNGTRSYIGDGVSSIYIWGAQLVEGTEPKRYYPTTNRLNIPRIDYSNGIQPGILLEPQRTNLIVRSEEFDNVSWGKTNASVISNAIISPSGLMDGDKLVENDTLNIHNIYVFTGGTELRTNSIFVKAGERSRFILWAGASGYMFDLVNLTTTPGNNSTSITSTSIQDYGNGWYRCSITSGAGPNNGYSISLLDNETNPETPSPQYQGDGVSGLYIWGAQRENASSLTSYIPTVSAAVTRNEDQIYNNNLPLSVIPNDKGTMYCEVFKNTTSFSQASVLGTNSEFLLFGLVNDSFRVGFRLDGGNTSLKLGNSDGTAPKSNGVHKLLLTFGDEVINFYCDGEFITSRAYSGNFKFHEVAEGNRINLSRLPGSIATNPSLEIRSIIIYKTILSEDEAILLTQDHGVDYFNSYSEMSESLNYKIQ